MTGDQALVDRMLNVFNDTPEIAVWFEQSAQFYDYEKGEVRTHLLGMWETMQDAARRIEELSAENARMREVLTMVDNLINHQFTGSQRAMSDLMLANQNAFFVLNGFYAGEQGST
jgi:hypothetical protein